MSETGAAELVWIRADGGTRCVVLASKGASRSTLRSSVVQCANLRLPLLTKLPKRSVVVYRHPIQLQTRDGRAVAGPVFAILAGNRHFTGSRADFRDVSRTGRSGNAFIYVLPTECVTESKTWTGYVRVGYQKWMPIPCPRPEAIYNRIPNRVLEVNQHARRAKERIHREHIPMFNPGYFSKAEIYGVLRTAGLSHFLPRTIDQMTPTSFQSMLRDFGGVYLKPTSSSVGHGIMRVDKTGGPRHYRIRVLKNLSNNEYHATSMREAWQLVQKHRIPGKYVIQQAIPLVEWEGKPADLRVLLQKHGPKWVVVGKGVRVAGATSITTHVPTGGSIVALSRLLERAFPELSDEVEGHVEELALACANAIDAHYNGQLGEMSMDVGVDKEGKVWLFEANSKPMKFDEPNIREKSLKGVLRRLLELRKSTAIQ